ncbi:uncharacterized protein L3040_005011 [Drepanopeziza brunnea f. sp. 'multigermtubi']|uniref:uncharacterized protein n=1 Tax=Drepanopeziza brunnea f. sp. 'multigermtubi' TaxID=698441 RepID=UPI0023878E94|nr:hypothetical protein L3040_005011 [Drepanopeziza brunnea f. sp. 'multigermtubi']
MATSISLWKENNSLGIFSAIYDDMSLLGRLLSGAGTSISSPRNPLDSHLEDQFTYNLLFPDPEALCHNDDQVFPLSSATILPPAASRDADLNGEVDLEMRDVRVIIMQETTPASGSSYLLYDSHSPSPPSPSWDRPAFNGPAYPAQEARGAITAPRKTKETPAAPRRKGSARPGSTRKR